MTTTTKAMSTARRIWPLRLRRLRASCLSTMLLVPGVTIVAALPANTAPDAEGAGPRARPFLVVRLVAASIVPRRLRLGHA